MSIDIPTIYLGLHYREQMWGELKSMCISLRGGKSKMNMINILQYSRGYILKFLLGVLLFIS